MSTSMINYKENTRKLCQIKKDSLFTGFYTTEHFICKSKDLSLILQNYCYFLSVFSALADGLSLEFEWQQVSLSF